MDGLATGQWTMAVCLALWNLVSHCVVSEVEETALRETRVPFHSQGGICYTIIIQISFNITVINNAKKKSVRREDVKEEEKKEKMLGFFFCSPLSLYPEELTKANNTIVILTIQNQHRLFAFCHLLTQNFLLFMFSSFSSWKRLSLSLSSVYITNLKQQELYIILWYKKKPRDIRPANGLSRKERFQGCCVLVVLRLQDFNEQPGPPEWILTDNSGPMTSDLWR